MDNYIIRMMDAAEACFEADPSPKNDSWMEVFVSHFVSHEAQKVTQKHTWSTAKTDKNDSKQSKSKRRKT